MSDVTPRSNGRAKRKPKPQKYTADSVVIVADAVIGAVDLDTEEGRARVVGAITDTGAEGARFRSLCDIKSRGLRPTLAQRELIESCDDVAQLDTWCDRALTATTIAMVFED
jgi:hypothetical protein